MVADPLGARVYAIAEVPFDFDKTALVRALDVQTGGLLWAAVYNGTWWGAWLGFMREAWSGQRAIQSIMVFLQGHGIGTSQAVRIYKRYGDKAVAVIDTGSSAAYGLSTVSKTNFNNSASNQSVVARDRTGSPVH